MNNITEIDFPSILNNIDNCFFIEVGANDGIYLDPLYPYIIKNNWSGILIEPNHIVFEELKNNYKNTNNLFFENCIVSDKSGMVDFYYNGDNITTLHNTLSYNYAKNNFKEDLKIVPTLSLTFDDLIQKHNVKKVDVLMTDVEGYDLDLLKTFPFNNIKPKVIISEHAHLYHQNQTLEDIINFLGNQGYEYYINDSDIVGILK
jgi:FkbM family methyltransferase